MPKTPTTLCIVPSKIALAVHVGLCIGVVGLMGWWSPPWLALLAFIVLSVVLVQWRAARPRGELRAIPQAIGETRWSWRDDPAAAWQEVTLNCDYLGPWLIGLELDGQRLWLWPDSCDAPLRRSLRRELVTLP
ncbi:hypothetical protein KG088_01580 [Halomonas sp. TRM85114]|uniref:protein YgfX n=1 Tax=Halomonas jincaotanensis TaxID=2810616 RepID=UPI001BD6BD56|nr:protein YgfX [Halomonas jincaotanensis]MBS9402314.1 hypothetical protein [Halomonas jincaotanensis]